MLKRPSLHTAEISEINVRSKVRGALMIMSLGATTLPATACHEGFAVKLTSGELAGGIEPSEEQEEIVHGGMRLMGVDGYHIVNDEVETYRGTMKLVSITTNQQGAKAGLTTLNSRCRKEAIIPAEKGSFPGCEDETCATPGELATAHEIGHLLGLSHTCDCYDECPSDEGVIPNCSDKNSEEACILCTGAEGEDKCTEENDTDLMNGAFSGPYSTHLSNGEKDTVDKKARRFDRCAGGW